MPQFEDDPRTRPSLAPKGIEPHLKALERAEFAKICQRTEQLFSQTSANHKKMLERLVPNANGVRFLRVDLDVALNFAKIALHSNSDHDKRTRNQANARKAHDTIVHWKNRLEISRRDALEIDAKLQKLRAALEKLGERL